MLFDANREASRDEWFIAGAEPGITPPVIRHTDVFTLANLSEGAQSPVPMLGPLWLPHNRYLRLDRGNAAATNRH